MEVKGGFRQLLSTRIVITTNIHPRLWYDYSQRERQYKALARRFHEVYWHASVDKCDEVDHSSFFDGWFEGCDELSVFQPVASLSEDTATTIIVSESTDVEYL